MFLVLFSFIDRYKINTFCLLFGAIMEAPPVLPSLDNELRKYLLCPENLPIHQYERNQKFWSRDPNPKELLYFEGSPLTTTLQVIGLLIYFNGTI